MIKQALQNDMKTAMRAGEKQKLAAIRLILSAIKQYEVDNQTTIDDANTLVVLDKMLKQRRDSIEQYQQAGRESLAENEQFEIDVIQQYLPEPLTESEITDLIVSTITETGAESIKDMGKVMAILKPKIQGRADIGKVSAQIKQQFS